MRGSWKIAVAVLCVSVAGACGDDDDGGNLSDQEIVGVLQAANQGEVDLGQLAVGKAQAPAVQQFAQRMVTEHSGALQHLNQISEDARVPADDSATSASLEATVAGERTALDATDQGEEFDIRYMCGQVRLHRTVLETIDDDLKPAADDQRIKSEVDATRPVVADHLEMARGIVRELSGQDPATACNDRGGV